MPLVNWTRTDSRWQALSDYQKAAAMAIMEADGRDPEAQANVLHAIVNRAQKNGQGLGSHVEKRWYQPVIEPTQQARLGRILQDPRYGELTKEAEGTYSGSIPRRHAETHYLAPEKVMLGLEAREPNKYKSWRKWTNFDPATNSYRGVAFRDKSHAFLSPEGRYNGAVLASGSVPAGPPPPGPPAPGAAPTAQPPRGPQAYALAGGGGAGSTRQADPIGDLIKRTAGPPGAGRDVVGSPDPIASLLSRLGDSPATQGGGDGSAQRHHAKFAEEANQEGDRQMLEILRQMRERRARKGGR